MKTAEEILMIILSGDESWTIANPISKQIKCNCVTPTSKAIIQAMEIYAQQFKKPNS